MNMLIEADKKYLEYTTRGSRSAGGGREPHQHSLGRDRAEAGDQGGLPGRSAGAIQMLGEIHGPGATETFVRMTKEWAVVRDSSAAKTKGETCESGFSSKQE
jgi:hypothetical protein